ncbi:MAG: hypothetical protein ACE5JI_03575 [Acidobacteriota bacterium]
MFRRLLPMSLVLFLGSHAASAGEPFNLAVRVDKLATMFTALYGPQGLVVDSLTLLPSGDTHSAHFNSAFQAEFTQFGTALSSKLASVPLPSPASGFTYEFDPALGVFARSTQSFGPVLAERAETIGGRRFSFGFTFQQFTFDTIEGQDLGNVLAVFTHDGFELRGGREDVVTTVNAIDAEVSQFTTFLTYGVTDRLDLSIAIPFVSADLTVVSDATIRRIGTSDESIHFFRELDGDVGDRRVFTAFGSASGLGDVTLRLKGTVLKKGAAGLALGLDLRVPTGDEENLLGVGAPGVKPFVVWSTSYGPFSPHINAGYLWNGSSLLAGDPSSGKASHLPDQAFYVVGADIGVSSRFTLSFDVLGQYVFDSPRLVRQDFHALDGKSVFPNVTFREDSFNELSAAVGFKLNLVEDLLLDFNVLFNVDDNGLRDKVTPLIGLEYAF